MKKLQQLLEVHAALLEQNPHCYFELAYTRQTMWMAWLCSKPSSDDANRKVLAKGQGETAELAAEAALKSLSPDDVEVYQNEREARRKLIVDLMSLGTIPRFNVLKAGGWISDSDVKTGEKVPWDEAFDRAERSGELARLRALIDEEIFRR